MSDGRGRLEKVLALAINPGAVEGEAIAALLRARELVKQNPALAHPPSPAPISSSKPDHPESSFRVRITGVHPDWLLILVSLLSNTGYEVGVKYRIDFDFSETFVAVTTVCNGTEAQCKAYEFNVEWSVNYINDKLKNKTV
jgi:hypothetical protein